VIVEIIFLTGRVKLCIFGSHLTLLNIAENQFYAMVRAFFRWINQVRLQYPHKADEKGSSPKEQASHPPLTGAFSN